MMYGMKRAKIVKMWAGLGDARPRFGDFEDYMNRPMHRGPYGFLRYRDVYEYLTRGEYWWMYLRAFRRDCSRRVEKLKAAERRPRYYAAEKERRRALAAERRKIRARTTTNVCPTCEAILEAWRRRRDSHEAAIRFGSLLEDLECYLDNSLRRDECGVIIGRNPGIKGWLCDNLPEILDKYTTAMRYKAAAKKLKQVVDLADPTPADVVLPREAAASDSGSDDSAAGAMPQNSETVSTTGTTQLDVAAERKGSVKRDYGADEVVGGGAVGSGGGVEGRGECEIREYGEVPELAVVRARAIWVEVVRGIGPSATALMARLDALTDSEMVDDANMLAEWREKYMNEITERTKKRWWRRLVKAVGSGCAEGRLKRRAVA
jgi:hypothetical protein